MRLFRRRGPDRVRFAIRPVAPSAGGGFEVQILVNGKPLAATSTWMMGIDPRDVLVPENRFVATSEPTAVPIVRCGCGSYLCNGRDATITRIGDRVRWTWDPDPQPAQTLVFEAEQYDHEVARLGADRSWTAP